MRKLFVFALFNAVWFTSVACTTFCIKGNGQILFGRNYDWVSGAGIIHVNKKGLHKTSFQVKDGKTISWTALYGSITFNQYGKEFPTGGMNEKGLVVELMWLDETKYPDPDNRPALMVLQWIQYQLDNAATINEVIDSDKKVRISSNGTPLHYLIADAEGNVATLEFLNGALVVHKDKQLPFPVLTNTTYATALPVGVNAVRKANSLIPNDNSLQRFAKACKRLNNIEGGKVKGSLTDEAFNILSEVSQEGFTKWSIVYNITEKKIEFVTSQNKNRRSLHFSGVDFNCKANSLMYDLAGTDTGKVNEKLVKDDDKVKTMALKRAADDSRQYVDINADEVAALLSYSRSIYCNK